jgi:hypothetical protein
MNPLRTSATILIAIATATLIACAPIRVTSFTERGVDVGRYRTFAWDRIDPAVPGDPRLDNNPFFHEYLRGAIDRQLVSRGYEPTMLQPDVRVHYHASSRQGIYTAGPDHAGHYGNGVESITERCRDCVVEVYEDGTLLVDLTDGRTGALLWRGVAESGLAGVVNSQTRMEETIERVVERIFARLPRRS